MSPLERDMAELAMASLFEREPQMTTDDTRHPTDAEMDALEAIVHPEGRCAVCGGGKPYWKHTANETEYHPFTPTTDDTRPLTEAESHLRFLMASAADDHVFEFGPDADDAINRLLATLDAERARHAALVRAARAAVDAAGTNNWPVNCDALRAALDGEDR